MNLSEGIITVQETRVVAFEVRGGDSIVPFASVNAAGEVTVLDIAVAEHVASRSKLDTGVVVAKLIVAAYDLGKKHEAERT